MKLVHSPSRRVEDRPFFSFVSIGHGSRGVGLERARLRTGRAAAAPELGLAPARRGQRLAQRPVEPRRRRDPGRRRQQPAAAEPMQRRTTHRRLAAAEQGSGVGQRGHAAATPARGDAAAE
jgi:hypothetical protein